MKYERLAPDDETLRALYYLDRRKQESEAHWADRIEKTLAALDSFARDLPALQAAAVAYAEEARRATEISESVAA